MKIIILDKPNEYRIVHQTRNSGNQKFLFVPRMSDDRDSQMTAAAEPSDDRSGSKKKDKSSKKRKESEKTESGSTESTGKPKKKDGKEKGKEKEKEKAKAKDKERSKSKDKTAKKGAATDASDDKPKAKKSKAKKKPLFYGTAEDRWLLRTRDLLLRQAAIKRLIKAILARDEMLSNIRISKNAVIALHTLVNAYIQHRFKASQLTMKTVNPKRATLSVNYVKASYLTGELYMGRDPKLPEEYLDLPEKKAKGQGQKDKEKENEEEEASSSKKKGGSVKKGPIGKSKKSSKSDKSSSSA